MTNHDNKMRNPIKHQLQPLKVEKHSAIVIQDYKTERYNGTPLPVKKGEGEAPCIFIPKRASIDATNDNIRFASMRSVSQTSTPDSSGSCKSEFYYVPTPLSRAGALAPLDSFDYEIGARNQRKCEWQETTKKKQSRFNEYSIKLEDRRHV
eukprot:GEZU01001126.1.p1 GENE.GEZU01001126.1~~GEZU01001126.1.p1  ORF type:complete len:151 (+),score=23.91 GEZU01001126.1:213-665(+)